MTEDKVTDNHSLYLYLTSAMLRKPKFSKVSCWKLCKWRMSGAHRYKMKLKRFQRGKETLEKDLDVRAHLRT